MNNNKTNETALLGHGKGVFSKTSYITIGTKDQPESYGKSDPLRSNYSGKQFIAMSSKKGKTPNTFFSKKHDWISDGDAFTDRTRYFETQKEKSKGFLTSDFHRRDEFSNTIRTEQWREQLKQEAKFAKATLEVISENELPIVAQAKTQNDDILLYDRVFEKEGDDGNRMGLNCKERNLGNLSTTYSLTHQPPITFEKPQFARKPIIRDTFYRKMNIPFAQN